MLVLEQKEKKKTLKQIEKIDLSQWLPHELHKEDDSKKILNIEQVLTLIQEHALFHSEAFEYMCE